MESIVLIQARLSSTRLPAKVLLPVASIPLVVLTAKRASNTGRNILVVTSNEPSDDVLCEELTRHKIKYYRGALNNTLERFVSALHGYHDQTIVYRLTADNVLPDGSLLDELGDFFESNGLNYLACNGKESGLPYGVSVELMRLHSLRQAILNTTNPFDLEHVTPYIKRVFGSYYYQKYLSLKMGAYRCSVDSFDDYLAINKVFSSVIDPEGVSWLSLVDAVKENDELTVVESPVDKLVLGGAQIGLNYGINNKAGKPSQFLAERMVKKAISNGVEYIDTARAYGESEQVLGNILQKGWASRVNVITKLSPLKGCDENSTAKFVKTKVCESVFESCQKLRVTMLDYLLVHRVEHIFNWDGAVWEELIKLKKEGVINCLGVSVQSPRELELILEVAEIELIQMPFNIIDSRWKKQIEKIKERKRTGNLIIHARSSLLQGLLVSSDISLWEKANLTNASEIIEWLKRTANKFDCISVTELALNYVKSQEWVDGVVVGMETEKFLDENLSFFSRKYFLNSDLDYIESNRPVLSEMFLNPAKWKV